MKQERIILVNTLTKICTKCSKELPATLEYFYKGKLKNKYGLEAQCKICKNSSGAKWREANKEEHKQMRKDWRANNEEHIKNYKSEYDSNHKEESKQYRAKNKLKLSKQKHEYYKENKEEILERNRLWRIKNKDKMRVYKLRYKAKAESDMLEYDDWLYCLDYFNHSCAYCGKKTFNLHGDHVIPVSKDGKTIKSNIISACPRCNLSKRDKDMEEWYKSQDFFSKSRLIRINEFISRRESDWNSETRENSIERKGGR